MIWLDERESRTSNLERLLRRNKVDVDGLNSLTLDADVFSRLRDQGWVER